MPLELRYRNGSVWVKAVQINVFYATSNRYTDGRFLIYFSFSRPGGVFYAETLKDERNNLLFRDTEQDGLNYAGQYFGQQLG